MPSNNIGVFTGTTPAAPGTAILGQLQPNISLNGTPNFVETNMNKFESMAINCIRQGATGGTLDIYIQASYDEGVTWTDIGHYTQLAAAGSQVQDLVTYTRYQGTITPVITGDAAIASNTFIQGEFSNRVRFKAVAGAGTSAGAAYTIKVYVNTTGSGT